MPASISSNTSSGPRRPAARDELAGPSAGTGTRHDVRHAEQRQHHPRELAPRGDLAQRPRRQPRVRRDHQLDRVRPARPAPALARAHLDRELARRAWPARPAARAPRRRAPAPPARDARTARPPVARAPPAPRQLRLGLSRETSARSSSSRRARQRSAWARTSAIEPPCFRSSRANSASRSSTSSSRPGEPSSPSTYERSAALERPGPRRRAPRRARHMPASCGSMPARRLQPARRPRPAARPRHRRRPRARSPRRPPNAAPRKRLEVAQALALTGQIRRLSLARRHPLDLVELEAEQVELALAPGGDRSQRPRPAPRDCAHARMPRPRCRAASPPSAPALTVEHVELHGREHQPAVLVLAVEGQQRAARARAGRPRVAERPHT